MPTNKYIIALDVGGSSIKSGIITNGIVSDINTRIIDSKANADSIIGFWAEIIQRLWPQGLPQGIAFSIPGPFDYKEGISLMKGIDKYESLYGVNVKKALLKKLPEPCEMMFRNDAESAVIGEAVYGAGKPYKKLIGITLGTGFGSSFVNNGIPQKAAKDVPGNGELFSYKWQGQRADDLFSIRGLTKRLREEGFNESPKEAAEKALIHLEFKRVFETWGRDMGDFLNTYVKQFQPEAILFLGGLSGAFDVFENALSEVLKVPPVKGVLKEKAALLGASSMFE
jgi:glucokinase